MTGQELLRRLRRLARRRGVELRYEPRPGKGSHGLLIFGGRRTTLKDPRQELPKGTLRGILRQLGIRPEDLNE